MRVPMEWLTDYIKIGVDIDKFCERMIMSGSNIETVEHFGVDFKNVVVGKVLEKEKHPNADKLWVCIVDVGAEEPVKIVCGASNVHDGAVVPVALHKSRVPGPLGGQAKKEGGVEITKSKLRGVLSMGMICSAEELGFADKVIPVENRDGIWLSPQTLKPGTPYEEAMGLKSYVVDFEITPNRADCLSMIGIAREVSATFGKNLKYPPNDLKEEGHKEAKDFIAVEIENVEACPRYVARVVTDVKIGPSPWWLQKRLMYAGIRPINNVVDITNFVMLEQGNPIHAFDIRDIHGGKIAVGNAKKGETIVTLDGKERKLTEDMLLIRDGERGVAIAGIMGAQNSEVRGDTSTILVEVANFNDTCIRATAKKLGIRTEASSRFEKGVDPNICATVADRVCKLIEDLGVGKVQRGAVDVYPNPKTPWTVSARMSRINKVLGTNLSEEAMREILESLEMRVSVQGDDFQVTPPTIRADIKIEEDLIEEIARIYGYDCLPVTIPKGNIEADLGRNETLRRSASDALCAMGANEIQTYSFVSPSDMDKVRIDEGAWERNFIVVKNPLGDDTSVMRTILTPAMLTTLGYNYARNIEEVKAFEIGTTFTKNLIDLKALPDEQDSLVIGLYGASFDFFTLKGMVVALLKKLGITKVVFEAEPEYGIYHPGRCARILIKGQEMDKELHKKLLEDAASKKPEGTEEEIAMMREMVSLIANNMQGGAIELGIMGEVHPDVAETYGIGERCYCCELMFNVIGEFVNTAISYNPLPKYPSTSRDIALVVDENMAVGQIEEIIKKEGGELLETVKLFDIYRGDQVEDGKKSVAFSLTYRDGTKTLTEGEVAPVHQKVLSTLKESLDAVLREM